MKKFIPSLTVLILLVGLCVGAYFDLKYDYLEEAYRASLFGVILITSIILFIMINRMINHKNKEKIKNLEARLDIWSKISYHVNQVGEEVFNELPVGIILIDDRIEEIQWINPYASIILDGPELNEKIQNVNTELYELIKSKNSKAIVKIKDSKYECIYKKQFNVLYLFDVTEQEKIKEVYQKNLPAVALITFDNLEESVVGLDISEQSQIKSEYLGALSDWVESYSGYLKQLVDDRLLLLITRENLDKMMETKFDILETIRKISMGYQLKVTISMGIASWDISYEEIASYAQNAIELAQKRGGDQVVVNIENEKIHYFGAKTDASTKNSKVSARVNAQTIQELIKSSNTIFIMGHNQTDLDAFGSMLAMFKMAVSLDGESKLNKYLIVDEEKLDQTVHPVYLELLEKEPDLKKNIKTTEETTKMIKKDSLLVILDTQSKEIVNSPEILELTEKIVVIDHHRTSEKAIESMFSYVETSASSTIELLIELVNFFQDEVDITPFESSIMYAGLLVDTNTFTYRTSARTFEVASKLKELGADAIEVKSWLRHDILRTLEINKMTSQMEVFMDKFAIVSSDQIYDDRSFLAQVSESLLNIKGIDAAFTITKLDDITVGISARSYNQVNVQILMEQLGGGGHLNSAATQIKNVDIKTVTEQLKQLIRLEYEEGEIVRVILLEDVKGKGKKDEIIEVANGYGQFLVNGKKAVIANDVSLDALKKAQELAKQKELDYLELMQKIKSEIEGKKVTVGIQIGPDGRLYGTVTTKQIADEFEKEHGVTIDKKKIELSSEINSVGIYSATVSLTKDIKAQFEINVVGAN
ncbi:50S ribosomal protein L9 [Alteracholeplasma palmae J233]|uniref:Large ribosomal subunit protein bL9 n=1 Tax=Alteracholeplasma palmae (strain ATCC 49389 / J233) TaxID=1318466 RepID=U4KS89_ALTPJ|nr:50S ribosomal protein L9 [Alteracholeplasma palmae]CCV64831.1 50S ribosomal protein L9 [Alteracholeplasma palmae J233]